MLGEENKNYCIDLIECIFGLHLYGMSLLCHNMASTQEYTMLFFLRFIAFKIYEAPKNLFVFNAKIKRNIQTRKKQRKQALERKQHSCLRSTVP